MPNKVLLETRFNNKTIRIVHGDITEENVDAIVNAANEYLKHGGGVAGAIVRKGGYVIQEESDKIGYVPTGSAAITGAGKLPAKFVIHAVGPVWKDGKSGEDEKLESAVFSSLKIADEKKLKSISFPAISAGIFGFPKERCAKILIETAVKFLEQNPNTTIEEIRFCLFDEPTLNAFVNEFSTRFPESKNLLENKS
ncbi:macro domain-containing protein [Candidatus Kryptobacter tengchongensis]|uniref:O-acetyl-ADP-ribose deacetylase (Regulator of RNase III), contains Macro domain n=1 Tax=Kryptobacter tengchongensis TaxID=1643429 RepID=A0A656CW59_KRYT1|nr:macro domain-containing protein [Candidatus Kryptobacter tengchongensis]CUS77700.1 O-acetyl-ADP-ribose deacetylase (regulator of RNase III), contains Macro domain [Candidatus Kryptobacter tengchongensis]CUS96390.1 O-acetyl-ADP-ribose deacetylase (regulator of RNase III), contains Macro domain [Candidatus Kryptobacter tengchongensis]